MTALRDAIDYTTLGWIKPELDETLRQARIEIEGFAEDPSDGSRMRFCASYLHQVQGTLRMVELYAPAMVAEEMEHLAQALQTGDIADRDGACATLMRGVVLLPDYLERLQSGHKDIPIILLPLLNELRAARGETGLSESVLFAPDLERPLPEAISATVLKPAKGKTEALERLHALMTAWPEQGAPENPAELRDAIEAILPLTDQAPVQRMLWVAGLMMSAVQDAALPSSVALRQAFKSVEREVRRLFEDDGFGVTRAESALEPTRQLLYHAAHSSSSHPGLAELRKTFDLEAQLPSQSELEHARGSLTGRNRALLDTVSGAIKEDLLRVKDALDLHLRNTESSAADLLPQVEVLGRVGDTLGMLGLGVARGVIQQQREAMRSLARGDRPADENALLDVAGALLYVDATLDDQVARLGTGDAAGQEDLFSSESRKVLEVIAREAIANFADARQAFVAFVETSWDHNELMEIPRLLEEVTGALNMLELPIPAAYLVGIRRYAETELIARRRVPNGRMLDTLADALTSLEYYLEALREQRGNRDDILDIARNSLESLGYWPLPPEAVFEGISADAEDSASRRDGQAVLAAFMDRDGARDSFLDLSGSDTRAQNAEKDTTEDVTVARVAVPVSAPGTGNGGFETTGDEIDDEIRDVFLEEFEGEINNLDTLLPLWRAKPEDLERLRPIRRVFHTLKGSGRLVGARALGEFSWKIENMLNRVLDGTRVPSPAVIAMVDQAFYTMPQLLAALRGEGVVTADLEGVQAFADRVATGEEVLYTAPVGLTESEPESELESESESDSSTDSLEPAEASEMLPSAIPDTIRVEIEPVEAAERIGEQYFDATVAVNDAAIIDVSATAALFKSELPTEFIEIAEFFETPPSETPIDQAIELVQEIEPVESIERFEHHFNVSVATDDAAIVDVSAFDIAEAGIVFGEMALSSPSEFGESTDGLPASIDDLLLEILDSEVAGHLATVDAWLAEARVMPLPATDRLLRAIHTMNGAFAMTEVPSVPGALLPAEGYIRRLLASEHIPSGEGISAITALAEIIKITMQALHRPSPRIAPCDTLAAQLTQLRDSLPAAAAHPSITATEVDQSQSLSEEGLDAAEIDGAEWFEKALTDLDLSEYADLADVELVLEGSTQFDVDSIVPAEPDADWSESLLSFAEQIETERLQDAQNESVAQFQDIPADIAQIEQTPILNAEAELERQRLVDASILEAQRIESERLETERVTAERIAAERIAAERIEAERIEAERIEAERIEAERIEAERIEAERIEAERIEAERAESERLALVRLEAEQAATERAAYEQALAAERLEIERLQAEELEYARLEAEYAEADRIIKEQALDAERLIAERNEADRLETERVEVERADAERAEQASRRVKAERVEASRLEAERLAEERAEQARLVEAQTEASRLEAERAEVERFEQEQAKLLAEQQTARSTPSESDEAVVAEFNANACAAQDPDSALDLTGLDPDLIDIFVEEASDLLDHSDGLLAQLRDAPGEREALIGLQRDLHTLKGGARMTGLMAVGELGHVMESLLESVVEQRIDLDHHGIPLLERGFDRLHTMITRIGARRAIDPSERLIAEFDARSRGETMEAIAAESPTSVSAAAPAPKAALKPLSTPMRTALDSEEEDVDVRAPQEQVRIRADLLDRLVNYAGEVAIYRARLEQQLGMFRTAMGEMAQTNTRLRDQLRRLDSETEAQIIARYQREHDAGDELFDPLELDRFSTLQQLSRALGESANDMSSLQGTLEDLTRQYETLLLQQSRVSSDLQEGLMRTRMVPFDSLVPRLRRVVRQAATETGKQVQLKLEGAQGELDRNVLERMTAPLEHMLRNAVAHGMEAPQQRKKSGKPEEGVVRIAVRREGSEVVLEVGDDGSGLNRAAIRRRAEERGLVRPDAMLADADLDTLILEPGFSTADEVSRLAGRGVGMDVVASEVRQLGGALNITSRQGSGTTFTLRLPQTLAITQAVFVRIGDTRFAVPIASVRGVVRIARDELSKAGARYSYGGEEYALHDLGALVGGIAAKAEGQQQMPLLLIGSGDLRAAISVDQVIGNREIVVKPVGPQVASVPGIFGATIMGDGSVVVILDIAPWIRRLASFQGDGDAMPPPANASKRTQMVMVVDDSVTMRKVTGRVLERHQFEVTTAKDGIDALERMSERVPDLMLLDIEMPRMDGYELARQMKADPNLSNVPIIMITSRTGDKHRQRAFKLGVERYLGKPYQEQELLRNVFELLSMERNDG